MLALFSFLIARRRQSCDANANTKCIAGPSLLPWKRERTGRAERLARSLPLSLLFVGLLPSVHTQVCRLTTGGKGRVDGTELDVGCGKLALRWIWQA